MTRRREAPVDGGVVDDVVGYDGGDVGDDVVVVSNHKYSDDDLG